MANTGAREHAERDRDGDVGDLDAERECWVCGDPATHQDTTSPNEFTCDEHAVSIDAERFREDPTTHPAYADRAQAILAEALENWHDEEYDDRDKHTAAQRAMLTLKHEVDDELK